MIFIDAGHLRENLKRLFSEDREHLAILARTGSPTGSSPPTATSSIHCLRGVEQAHGSALAHHVHRTARLGSPVLINGTWYKTLSNEEWVSKTDPEARIARMKDGTTHLAYKPEHAVDLDTGAVVAAEVHAADEGDTTTITGTLDAARRNLTRVGAPPSSDDPAECVADKGYHARAVLKGLDQGPWKTRIAEPQRQGVSRWHGDTDARRAVYNNRTRLRSAVGKQAMRQRAELVERSFAHILDRGGLRRTWLRGQENVHKRYLIHVAGHNLGLLMRLLIGAGTPKEAVARGWCFLVLLPTSNGAYAALIMVLVAHSAIPALIVVNMRFDHRSD